ncbi:MAG TPA: hypothetical protein VFW11_17355 [Cyclobacteriaceae bacterium]|nr:hypothetical protein [Cyclobacteriaceae bacterium]
MTEHKNTLKNLEQLLTGEGHRCEERVRAEVDRIRRLLMIEVFPAEAIEQVTQYYQQALVWLMDSLFSHEDECYCQLEDLFLFIERHFRSHADGRVKVPEVYLARVKKEITGNVRRIQARLVALHADQRLIHLLLDAHKIIHRPSHRVVSIRDLRYVQALQRALLDLVECPTPEAGVDEALRSLIYLVNYNAARVVSYHAEYYCSLLAGAETSAEKIERLSYALKKISQAHVRAGLCYNPLAPSLKDQLCGYLLDEIHHLERVQLLFVASGSRPGVVSTFKLKLETSVSQLAYLLRIFMETKVVRNDNVAELLRFLSKFVMTKRTENISVESFRIKFYNVESGTRDSVRSLLMDMVRYIDKASP